MKVATFIEPGKMVITDTPKPVIEQETDAVIKIVRACVCGSDLWWYRGISKRESGSFAGHEAIGIVEEVGTKVTDVSKGDLLLFPLHMAVANVRLVRLDLMEIVQIIKLQKM